MIVEWTRDIIGLLFLFCYCSCWTIVGWFDVCKFARDSIEEDRWDVCVLLLLVELEEFFHEEIVISHDLNHCLTFFFRIYAHELLTFEHITLRIIIWDNNVKEVQQTIFFINKLKLFIALNDDYASIMRGHHLFASLTDLKKFWRWLAWYFKKSISSALFLSSANFFYLICFSRASFFFFNSSAVYSKWFFFSYNYRIVVLS